METPEQPDIDKLYTSLGGRNLSEFNNHFQLLYEDSPIRAVKLFFYYLSARGVDPLSQAMAFWAANGTVYISLLFDAGVTTEKSLTPTIAMSAVSLLPAVDTQFLFKFARAAGALKDPPAILRALRLVPALGDYSIVIPWLRSLSDHDDSHVRARTAKLLCNIRPSKGIIERHLRSRDARVRASVLEALYDSRAARHDEEMLKILRSSVTDPNHRVVANALVGLYRWGENEALDKMIAMCDLKQHLFRAAMAWAMGEIEDNRSIPALRRLTLDPSFTVRQRATHSLELLGSWDTSTELSLVKNCKVDTSLVLAGQ